MQKIMNMLVKSCKKTAELMDKQQFTTLSTAEKMQLQTHKAMCKTCRAYEDQSKMIDKIIARWFNTTKPTVTIKLDSEKKNKIIEELMKA